MSRIVKTIILIGTALSCGFSFFSEAWAQERPAFGSEGIGASIASAVARNSELTVQVALTNNYGHHIRVAVVTGGTATAASSNGVHYQMGKVSSFSSCPANRSEEITRCATTMPNEQFILMESGETAVASLLFNTSSAAKKEGTVSFVLRLLVRNATEKTDSLSSAARPTSNTPARVVTINFPLVPMTNAR